MELIITLVLVSLANLKIFKSVIVLPVGNKITKVSLVSKLAGNGYGYLLVVFGVLALLEIIFTLLKSNYAKVTFYLLLVLFVVALILVILVNPKF